jgi:hypothetical protein
VCWEEDREDGSWVEWKKGGGGGGAQKWDGD